MSINTNKIIKGTVGITKATLGIDSTDIQLRNKRLNICNNCVHNITKKNILGNLIKECSECGCNINLKIKINSESCPINKW